MQRNKVESSVAPVRGIKVPATMARYFPASSRVAGLCSRYIQCGLFLPKPVGLGCIVPGLPCC